MSTLTNGTDSELKRCLIETTLAAGVRDVESLIGQRKLRRVRRYMDGANRTWWFDLEPAEGQQQPSIRVDLHIVELELGGLDVN